MLSGPDATRDGLADLPGSDYDNDFIHEVLHFG
jgi:hypothetical protein